MFLNVWTMDTTNGTGRPDYRDTDRRTYLFKEYQRTCTETFEKIDGQGWAIPEPDGTYKIKDIGRRVCLGGVQSKNRRSGESNKSLSDGLEVATRTLLTEFSFGIMAQTGNASLEHYTDKLMPAFEKLPTFLKPLVVTESKTQMVFDKKATDYNEDGLSTKIKAAETADAKSAFDGKKIRHLLVDEQGKSDGVIERLSVLRPCQIQGELIHGYLYMPSTVEQISEGAGEFEYICSQSNFYRRMSDGRTFSNLFRLFHSAPYMYEGYIDSYGYSVVGEIKDYQREEGFTETADQILQGKYDSLLASGTPEDLELLRQERKKFPLFYDDSFLGDSGNMGFDVQAIDMRQAELRRSPETKNYKLEWIKGFGGPVRPIEHPDGPFVISQMPDPRYSNQFKTQEFYYNGAYVRMKAPLVMGPGVIGADPFGWMTEAESKISYQHTKSKSKKSDGGIASFMCYDESIDGGKPEEEWKTNKFSMTYRHRHTNTDAYNEDVLKAAIFWGYMVYPENNRPTTYEYFIKKGFGPYLLYGKDPINQKKNPKPGFSTQAAGNQNKQKIFEKILNYISGHCKGESHYNFLEECKTIKKAEEMRTKDLLVAGGMCLLGAEELNSYVVSVESQSDKYDLSKFY